MNWSQRINLAKERGTFTGEDKKLANQWNRCAIGEKYHLTRDSLEQLGNLQKWDGQMQTIWQAGADFGDAVRYNDIHKAEVVFRKIQRLLPRALITKDKPE